MPVFPNLELEKQVQAQDKTRILAYKTFKTQDITTPFTSVLITPQVGITPIQVFVAPDADCPIDQNLWYLDYEYTYGQDIDSSLSNHTLKFKENNVALTATLTNGAYTLATLATEIETKMNAVGSLNYVVTLDDNKMTIAHDSGKLEILPLSSPLWVNLGFYSQEDRTLISKTTITGNTIRSLFRVCAVTALATATGTKKVLVEVFNPDTENLIIDDSDLIQDEPDVMRWVPEGRNTYKNIFRQAVKTIEEWLDKNGYVNLYGEKFTINDVYDKTEVKMWCLYLAHSMIQAQNKNAIDDIFAQKAEDYLKRANESRRRVVLRIDADKDRQTQKDEIILTNSIRMFNV